MFMHNSNVCLFGLLETTIKRGKTSQGALNLCRGWSFTTNLSHHLGGRIRMVWKPGMYEVNIVHSDAQMIHSGIMHRGTGKNFE